MKKFYAILLFCFLFFSAYSQIHPFQCTYPDQPTNDLPPGIGKYQKNEKSLVKLQTVVHVIFNDFDDLPDEAVEEIMAKVNEDFRRQNADTINTPDVFKPFAADTEIEFELASVNPSGGPTNGITHTKTSLDLDNPIDLYKVKFDSLGGKNAWNTSKYVNIWLASRSMYLGFSTSVSLHGTPQDGVVVGYRYGIFGPDERNLVHYLGHYLGLFHPFLYEYPQSSADTCSVAPGGPDKLEDTPNQLYSVQPYGYCPDFPYTDICSPDTIGVMYMNYMEYTPSDCKNMFTKQQAAAMHWVLDSIRFSLLEPVTSNDENGSIKNMEAHIYPNPVKDKLIVEFHAPTFSKKEFQFFDSTGRPVFAGVLDGSAHSKNEIDIAHLPNGIYLLKIISGHNIKINRVIKL